MIIHIPKTTYYHEWFIGATFVVPALPLTTQTSPNLVSIMANQYRGDTLGYSGEGPVKTPYLDHLTSEGVLFTSAVSSHPISSPARAILMTGTHPLRNKATGSHNLQTAPYEMELPQETRCWSDVLKDMNHHAGCIGKWHLDSPYKPYVDTYNNRDKVAWSGWCPSEHHHGFEYWTAYGTYDYHLRPVCWDATAPRDDFYYVNQWSPIYEADKAIEYIRAQKENKQPFALVVPMNPPYTDYKLVLDKCRAIYKNMDVEILCAHRPDIPTKDTEMGNYFRNNIRNYYACITEVDERVGRIVETLKSNGLFENTIVIFTSDHGICMGTHNNAGKDIFYEESVHIPMIISWPAKIKPRKDNHLMIAFADLYPPLLSLMGFQKEIPEMVQTFDLSRHILGRNKKEVVQPCYYIQFDNHATGYRGLRTLAHTFAVHTTDGKMDETVLYGRTKGPYQMDNIAGQFPRLIRRFNKRLKAWLLHANDSFAHYLKTVTK